MLTTLRRQAGTLANARRHSAHAVDRAAGEGPDQDRGDGRPGVALAGDASAADRGRGGRVPAELLARHARGAFREPGRRSARRPTRSGAWSASCRTSAGRRSAWGRSPATRSSATSATSSRWSSRPTGERPARADLHLRELTARPEAGRQRPVRRRHGGDGGDRGRREGRRPARVTLPGRLRSQQGINLPGAALSVQALTEKDLHDLDWTAAARGRLRRAVVRPAGRRHRPPAPRAGRPGRSTPRIVAKIEKPQAVGEPRRDHRRGRRGDGRPGRPGGRDGRGARCRRSRSGSSPPATRRGCR